ncbi:2OG-Fe(II) oxygenase family protein [Antribacter gilvus]|uniref:2OG-Fe(II) oxygenase family protein n=1 Tax=Antribacter gilvus TaxID=2304675 RepID=UPI000F7918DE|nr:2OG-Fe(II) oxygenase family protein [Antribacter gilvus]
MTVQQENAGAATPVHGLFDVVSTDSLTREHIVSLAAGTTAAVQVKNFFDVGFCTEIMDALETCELGAYDEQVVVPRIAKLGPAAYDAYFDGQLADSYWEHADQATTTRRSLVSGRDPLWTAFDRLESAWGTSRIDCATVGGRQLFAGMIREINKGARMHFDEVVREFPGVFDEMPLVQLAFNCHLAMPETGGEATVFRRRWHPQDENHRDGYGYSAELVEGQPNVSLRTEVGDAMLFDPRNYHRVEPATGAGRRVTLSFFIGITADGRLIAWS